MKKHSLREAPAIRIAGLALLILALLAPAAWAQASYQAQYQMDGYTLTIDANVVGTGLEQAPVVRARGRVWAPQALSTALGDSVSVQINEQGTIELRQEGRFEASAYSDGAFHYLAQDFRKRILEMDDYALEHQPPSSQLAGFSLDQAYDLAAVFLTQIGAEPGDLVSYLPVDSAYYAQMAGTELEAGEEGYLLHIGLKLNGLPITPYSYWSPAVGYSVKGSSAFAYVTGQGVRYLYIDGDATCYQQVSAGEDKPLISFQQAEAAFVDKYRQLYLDYDLVIGAVAFVYLPVPDPREEDWVTLVPTWGFFTQSQLDAYNDSTYINATTGQEMY